MGFGINADHVQRTVINAGAEKASGVEKLAAALKDANMDLREEIAGVHPKKLGQTQMTETAHGTQPKQGLLRATLTPNPHQQSSSEHAQTLAGATAVAMDGQIEKELKKKKSKFEEKLEKLKLFAPSLEGIKDLPAEEQNVVQEFMQNLRSIFKRQTELKQLERREEELEELNRQKDLDERGSARG